MGLYYVLRLYLSSPQTYKFICKYQTGCVIPFGYNLAAMNVFPTFVIGTDSGAGKNFEEMDYQNDKDVSVLMGEIVTKIENKENCELWFTCESGKIYAMYHDQDCCESVGVDDIEGDLNDLLNSPILQAEEVASELPARDNYDESFTWTFYKLATVKGYVTLKWYGTSNGYYSESVSFNLTNP